MNIQLLWWAGCPSTDKALGELREALDEVGAGEVEVRMQEIRSQADAERLGFAGSPTVLIDGVDAVPVEAGEPVGLSCRVYRRRDGRIAPTPDPDDLREALRNALAREEVNS